MADDKTILEIGTLLEKIKKEEIEINNGIESLGGIDGKELGLNEILQMFEESKATFNSLLKNELPAKFGEEYDDNHNIDYFIRKCHEIAGGGYESNWAS